MSHTPTIAFFGTPQIAVWVLEELEKKGITPSLVVTNPDAPQGRKMLLTPSPVSDWADERHIPVYKPESLKSVDVAERLKNSGCDLFIVAAYGKIIPQALLDIPKYKVLNVHPSLLPLLRGPSPIRSAILEDMNPTGVSIMVLTAGMDEGPLLAQETVTFSKDEWPMRGNGLDELLARKGGVLLADTLPQWTEGIIVPQEQEHSRATYSHKITKEMAEISLDDDPYTNLLKIRAFDGWPGAFFFYEKDGRNIRIKIIDAEIQNEALVLTRIIPEGKKEMSWEDFLRG